MGNNISRDEHLDEIRKLREENEKQRKDMEERHKEEIRQLEINSLRNQLSQYENKLKEAQTSYMECQKEQARRMESFYRDKDMMEETYHNLRIIYTIIPIVMSPSKNLPIS